MFMEKNTQNAMEIKRIGTDTITDEVLFKSIYKSLGTRQKFNRAITPSHIRNHVVKKELLYHPIWMVKNIVVAARTPFPPKKIPRIIFIDAVSGYRGLFSHVPHISEGRGGEGTVISPDIDREGVGEYIEDVRAKQINRSYMLKKPDHENRETTLVYLPIWEVTIQSNYIEGTFYINGNTGEDEKFMSDRWKNGKDLIR